MKQADIDSFRQVKADLADSMKRLQEGIREVHKEYNSLLRGFSCDHRNEDGTTAYIELNPYALICSVCNKTHPRRDHPLRTPCSNQECDNGILRDGPWGSNAPCPTCNNEPEYETHGAIDEAELISGPRYSGMPITMREEIGGWDDSDD